MATRLPSPQSLLDLQRMFPDEAACEDYLFRLRWPDSFVCPSCGGDRCWPHKRRLVQCAGCKRQVYLTAGTLMHRSRQPLRLWFTAAFLVSTLTPGISATQLQRQLGIRRYETA